MAKQPASTTATPQPTTAGKENSSRATWDAKSEEILITGAQAAAAKGQKADNNFKPQVYEEISRELKRAGYAYKSGQVKSRWNRFKASWKVVDHLRNLSGFGWDEVKKCVTATDDVWHALLHKKDSDEKIKKYHDYNYWRTHSFKYYKEIGELIGNNVATGDFAFSSESADTALTFETQDGDGFFNEALGEGDAQQEIESGANRAREEEEEEEEAEPAPVQATPASKVLVSKRVVVSPPPATPPPKRVRRNAGDQLSSLCNSVDKLVSGLISPSKRSPDRCQQRKDLAWKMIKSQEGLSPHTLARARKVFRGGNELVDEYLSFDQECEVERAARATWLSNEIDRQD